ncbi:MAG: prepilin-type N-terminal cleavage/methylation domain-containing protein [Dehalococcoidales bacterium]|nr:prepilin-type N-terminal cleavage/methylation domain-containing protein [Dehalococcoidales bacterium]
MVKKFLKQFKQGQKGFTLIELLVVVAILGVLAAVAIPNVAKFIGSGQSQAIATELANIQTAVTALLADAQVPELDEDYNNNVDPSLVKAGTGANAHNLAEYISASGLEAGVYASGQAYNIAKNGSVTLAGE